MEEIRINKYISKSGVCSRRAADKLINEGHVTINGVVAETGSKVTEKDIVRIDDDIINLIKDIKVYAFYKPVGYISSLSDEQGTGIASFLPQGMGLFPVGRLDKDSEGLMLITNDGNLMNDILNASNGHEKEYIVTTRQKFNNDFLVKMAKGVPITNRATGKKIITAPCKTEALEDNSFKITIIQGLNRQIRRMCGYFDIDVVSLKRVRIMNIMLGNMRPGELKELSQSELIKLRRMLEKV